MEVEKICDYCHEQSAEGCVFRDTPHGKDDYKWFCSACGDKMANRYKKMVEELNGNKNERML